MSLSPRERFQMIRQMVDQIELVDTWSMTTLDILVQQFGFDPIEPEQWESAASAFTRLIGRTTDEHLLGIYATVLDIPDEDARQSASTPDDHGLWNEGQVRVFLSHTAREKDFVGDVSRELAVVGVHGFVAHETMKIEKPWQNQIEIALRTAEAFVGLVHEPFNDSKWCQQEVGWAKGRGLPEFFIRLGANPEGFAGSTQWPSLYGRSAKEVSAEITAWLERTTDFTNRIVDGLVAALAEAHDYYSAEAVAKRITSLGALTDTSWAKLADAFWENDQVHGGVLPTRVLQPFYQQQGRDWPPPKPRLVTPQDDPWATTAGDEPPF